MNSRYSIKRDGGMVSLVKSRARDYADDYDTSNFRSSGGRRDYRETRSSSVSRQRTSRLSERSRSPHQFHERVYDGYAARDYSNSYDGGSYYDDFEDYDRDFDRDNVRDYRETYDRDTRCEERDRPNPRYRESRDVRTIVRTTSTSAPRDRYRERYSSHDIHEYYHVHHHDTSSRTRRDNDVRVVRDSSRDNREKVDREDRERYKDDSPPPPDSRYQQQSRDSGDSIRSYDIIRDVAPSSTVILQNIGPECTDTKIEENIKANGLTCYSVCVVRERTGQNKGFAFAEFEDINTAEKWLKLTNRSITIDGKAIVLNYSKSRRNDPNMPDWYCIKCKLLNFGRRRRLDKKATCYHCNALQTDSSDKDIKSNKEPTAITGEPMKVEPCNVLMVRGMDFSTTEETIRTALATLTTHPLFDVRLIRDKITNMSRGFAFIEMGSIEDAADLIETVEKLDPPFEIDSRRIMVGYARHGFNGPASGKKPNTPISSKQTPVENADSAANTTAEYSQYVVDSYTHTTLANSRVADATSVALSTANAGVAGAASAVSAMPSTYTYDHTSGYYFDSSTNLYYDPNTGYFYNSTTGKWLFWNGSRYQAVNQDGTPVTPATTSNETATTTATVACVTTTAENTVTTTETVTEEPKKPLNDDRDKVAVSFQKPKTARKIAKDMERWAKKMNTATEARKIAVKQAHEELKLLAQKEEELRQHILHESKIMGITLSAEVTPAPKETIRSLFVPDNEEEGSVLKLGSALAEPPSQKPKPTAVTVAEIPDDDDFIDESKFVDLNKIACLLCKRQFPSKDVLMKHLQMSQLHKESLEKYKRLKQAS